MNSNFDSNAYLKTLTSRPGVYSMLNAKGEVIYVGKAKNLKKRVASYFLKNNSSLKTQSLVKQITEIQVTITKTENEALLLECNLIKSLRPRYNVLFRDDKSYPYLYCSTDDKFPRLSLIRGGKSLKGRKFGPYPSASSARESLNLLQKLFKIRQCNNNFFKNRTRPCLQYQIKRCTAPCVNFIEQEQYNLDVRHALLFLEGKNTQAIEELISRMDAASQHLDYEQAVLYRDQIAKLRHVMEQQTISGDKGNIDVVAVAMAADLVCVQLLYIRKGKMIGTKAFFPKTPQNRELSEIYAQFLPQYYLSSIHIHDMPSIIIVEQEFNEQEWISQALSEQSEKTVKVVANVRKEKAQWLAMAKENALATLSQRISDKQSVYKRFESLQKALHLECLPQRIECFDISHSLGEATIGSCVVFDINGPAKSDYRHFNITGVTQGDDYAAMRQVLFRRYKKLKQGEGKIPDLVIIDGGKGQLKQAEQVIEELQLAGVCLLSIAKGPGRKAGLETLFLSGKEGGLELDPTTSAFHLIQQIRDEAHRFAITSHRNKRAKARKQSILEGIEGVGAKRRRDLLKYFGGIQPIQNASVEELCKVPGISKNIAQKIFNTLHDE